jgi:hypothetical protein
MVERHPMKSYLKPEEVAWLLLLPQKNQINLRSRNGLWNCQLQNIIKINR